MEKTMFRITIAVLLLVSALASADPIATAVVAEVASGDDVATGTVPFNGRLSAMRITVPTLSSAETVDFALTTPYGTYVSRTFDAGATYYCTPASFEYNLQELPIPDQTGYSITLSDPASGSEGLNIVFYGYDINN